MSEMLNAVRGIGIKGAVAYWTNKKEEEVTPKDYAKVFGVAITWPVWLVLSVFSGCGEEVIESCQDARPRSTTIEGPIPQYDYDISDSNQEPVTWKIYGIENCDHSTDGITATAYFGPEGTETATFEKAGDGTLTAVIRHKFKGNLGGKFEVTITGKNGEKEIVYLYPPYYKGPETPSPDPCAINSNPIILDGYSIGIDRDPYHEVYKGESFKVSFPRAGVMACDKTIGTDNDNLQAIFTSDISKKADINGTLFEASFTFETSGCREISMSVKDLTRGTKSEPYQSPKIEVCVNERPIHVGIQAPFSASYNTPVTFIVPDPTPGATYSWEFGDGETETGIDLTSVSHSYRFTGQYQVRLTGSLGGTTNSITHNISIVTTPVPMPAITAEHDPSYPRTGGYGYNIIFDATSSYSPIGLTITEYQVTYGDGTSEKNSSGIFYHRYPNPGPGNSGSYSALLTITDSNGQSNSISVNVSVWGDESP
jgi:hypothetical protein